MGSWGPGSKAPSTDLGQPGALCMCTHIHARTHARTQSLGLCGLYRKRKVLRTLTFISVSTTDTENFLYCFVSHGQRHSSSSFPESASWCQRKPKRSKGKEPSSSLSNTACFCYLCSCVRLRYPQCATRGETKADRK